MSLVISLGLAIQRPTAAAATLPAAAPPVNAALPVITGAATQGQTLTASTGTWTNGPTGFAWQWQRGGAAIAGATAGTYTAGAADVGSTLAVTVTAGNAGGSASATSVATGPVGAASGGTTPSIVTAAGVAVTATAYEAETYTFTPPVVAGSPTPTVTRVLTLDGVDVTGAMSGNVYAAARSETARRTLSMTYTASNGTAPDATSTVTASVPKAMHVVVWLGQSNIEYGLNNGSPYTNATLLANIPITTVNARYIGPDGAGGVADIPITQASVNARQINVALAQAAQWLNFVAPGKKFAFVDAAESGTQRKALYDDSNPGRDWADTADIVTHAQTAHAPADLLLEWWYTGVEPDLRNMRNAYMPFYIKQNADGSPFTLGTMHGDARVDHCLWDITAPLFDKGEGLFARGHTRYTYIRNHHKDGSLESSAGIAAFHADPRIQVFAAPQGVWGGHYANDSAHALLNDPDGQIQLQWPMAISIARLAGVTIHEPEYVGHEVAPDGSYCDILVSLPNGGTLSTTRIVEGRAAAAAPRSFMQPVMTMEVERFGSGLNRSPLHVPGAASFDLMVSRTAPENADMTTVTPGRRGTVTIHDTGSGSPRRGRIRITPEVPFVNGDRIVPQHPVNANPYAQTFDAATGLTQKYWLDFPVERVEALRDPAAFHKLPGIPVKPFGPIQTITGVAGAPFVFTPRSVVTNAGSRAQTPLASTVLAGSEGTISLWFRCTEATWPSSARTLLQARQPDGNAILALTTASNGRIAISFAGVYGATPVTGDFALGVWNHIALSWRAGAFSWMSRNGGAPRASTAIPDAGTMLIRTAGIRGLAVGSQTGGTGNWQGELGHVYLNLNEAIDLNDPAQRGRFFSGGVAGAGGPANFGQFGQLLTGTAPAFYFDGDGAAWSNVSGGPTVASLGTLAAGTAPARP